MTVNQESEYLDRTFDAISLRQVSLGGAEYMGCIFRNCKLDSVDLSGCSFEDCQFIGCSLVDLKLNNARFQNVSFDECKIVGINFAALNDFLIAFSMRYSILMSCTFSDMSIPSTVFEGCQISDTTFTNCNLKKADFSGVSFVDGRIADCDLREADFIDASGFQIDPNANKMRAAKFSRTAAVELLNGYGLKLV